ncbi:MAG: hypothetical protein KC457_25175 [Myxococcales bacterium]|nr:hypothetical protein [Myxococcales bacterium]
MTDAISKEIYPDIFDPSLPEQGEVNLERKRLYVAIRHLLREHFMIDRGKVDWDPNPQFTVTEPRDFPNNFGAKMAEAATLVTEDKVRFVAIFGQMLMAGHRDPSMGRLERGVFRSGDLTLNIPRPGGAPSGWAPDPSFPVAESFGTEPPGVAFRVHVVPEFVIHFTQAVQYYNANAGLFRQAFIQLRKDGVGGDAAASARSTISAKQLAEVTARLVNRGISPSDPHIVRHVINAISQTLGGIVDAHPSTLDIELPDLDAGTAVEIIPDNVAAVAAIYYSAQLEEMKLHGVMDKIAEHFQAGMLPISRSRAADYIYEWIKTTPERLTEIERRSLYGRTLGLAQGGMVDVLPNREFMDLWIRFLSTVSQKFREITSLERARVSGEQIHKAGRDLAVNLSLHGFAIAHPAGIEMQEIVRKVLAVLDEPEVLTAYGVRDRWQLVDRVSALYLGGSVNGVKYRTMAVTGSQLIRWLAANHSVLASGSVNSLGFFDSTGATAEFRTLADWCERWLAVAGFASDQAASHIDPVDLQQQHTVPMLGQNLQLPSAVRDALQQAGGLMPNLPAIPQA